MSSFRSSMSVSPLTPTPALPAILPNPNIANILAFINHLHSALSGIYNAPGELRALADDLAHAAAELHQIRILSSSDELEWALDAVHDDLNELERNIVQYSSLLRQGWRTTIPNLQFARNCARLREKFGVDVQAALTLYRRASATSTVFEEELKAAIDEEEEERDVLTKLPPPVFVSKASRKWRRAVEDADDQDHLWSPVSAENIETARVGYDRERREAMVRQIRTEDEERGETDLISIMATPTVLSFSKGPARGPWAPKAMSVHHVEKSYFSPPPSSPVPPTRKLAFVDTKGGVLAQTLPFLGVVITSLVALARVGGTSSLVLGFSLASALLSGIPLVTLLTDVFFAKDAREVLGRWWASAIAVAFFFLGTSCLVVGAGARSDSGRWLSGVDDEDLRSLAPILLIVIGVLEALCFGVTVVFFMPKVDESVPRGIWA